MRSTSVERIFNYYSPYRSNPLICNNEDMSIDCSSLSNEKKHSALKGAIGGNVNIIGGEREKE